MDLLQVGETISQLVQMVLDGNAKKLVLANVSQVEENQ